MSHQAASTAIFKRICGAAAVVLVAVVTLLATSLPAARAETTARLSAPTDSQNSVPRHGHDDDCGWFFGYYVDFNGVLQYGWYWSCDDDR